MATIFEDNARMRLRKGRGYLVRGRYAVQVVQGLVVPGAGAGASTPDQAVLNSGTNTLDLRVRATQASWADGVNYRSYIAQRQANADSRWDLYTDPGGLLTVTWFGPGAANSTLGSSVAVPFAAGGTGWTRALIDFTTPLCTFFTATDAPGAVWAPLGTTFNPGTLGLQVAGAPPAVKVGQDLFGNPAVGKIHRAMVIIGGVTRIDMDFSTATPGNGPWVATTGETWTRIGASTVA